MRTNNSIALDFKGIDLTGESLVLTGACDTLKRAHLASGFLICCGMLIDGVAGEACVCRYDLSIAYTEPDTEDEEPEEICTAHIYACNGYDLTIVNDAVTAVAAPDASAIDARLTTLEGVVGDDKIIVDEITSTGNSITASKPIIEAMGGYSFSSAYLDSKISLNYVGVCKNGNKLTFVIAGELNAVSDIAPGTGLQLGEFVLPASIGANLIPNFDTNKIGPDSLFLATSNFSGLFIMSYITKWSNVSFSPYMVASVGITAGTYYFRYEATFLLSDNLVS